MSMASACPIELTALMRAELRRLVRAPTTAQSLVSRARIVLLAADGHTNAAIGELTGVCTDTARKWRARFAHNGMDGLDAMRAARVAHRGSPRCKWPGPRRWPANCRPSRDCHCPGGAPPTWPSR